MSDLHTRVVRLAASFPKGSDERRTLLAILKDVNPAQAIWDRFVRDGIRMKKTLTSPHRVNMEVRTTNERRVVGLLKGLGWREVGDNQFSYPGGYKAVLDKGSRGVTLLKVSGPHTEIDIKTPPKLNKYLRAIMSVGWRKGSVTVDEAYDAVYKVGIVKPGKVDGFLRKLVGYRYLVPSGDRYKVTSKGMSAS